MRAPLRVALLLGLGVLLAAGGTAAAAPRAGSSVPVAVTGSASAIAPTSATLNGTVDPGGQPTTWYFEYGTTTTYGKTTPKKNAPASPGAVSAPVDKLTLGVTYHFRLVATNGAGTSTGADQTFVTSAAPTVTIKPVSGQTATGATLNGSVTPNGLATTAHFEYGTSASYGTSTAVVNLGSGGGAKNVTATIGGLTPGVTYHYRLVATNSAGTTASADQTFASPGPPDAHTGAATAVTGTSATLTGTVDPRGHGTNWYFEFGTTTAYGTKTASTNAGAKAGSQSVSTAIGGLTPGTTYHFRLVATSSAGTGLGADGTFKTAGPALTISAAGVVVYGNRLTLHGALASKQANASVSVFAKKLTDGSFIALATVLTGADGTWSLSVKPAILTTYKAMFGGESASRNVAVRPAVSLGRLARGGFTTHVAAARSFAGKIVQLQRRRNGRWITIARHRLNSRSSAAFRPTLPHGQSVLRVAISVNQAGSGYLAGFSRTLTVFKG